MLPDALLCTVINVAGCLALHGRVLTVRYEDLAQDIESITSIIYKFVGLDMLPSVQKFLKQLTSTNARKKNGKIAAKSTFRKDPFKTAYKWRQALPFSLVQSVDKACQELYHELGYVAFQREDELRNMHIPAKFQYYGEDLMTASVLYH
ncbi:hypothetical protein PoB_005284800 [Plakobranchus ocellatus]|uniref:Sulfotransferase domain-containing protein n=1 Tax=Plakobranchus ocellatus TaxID=259542 RepID=A0AAV4C4J8_9GAST|nr:hypothetical protein PoB_005284800 [Plakobranchus ocellatus]